MLCNTMNMSSTAMTAVATNFVQLYIDSTLATNSNNHWMSISSQG